MSLAAKQHDLIEDLKLLADPHERLSVVVSQGTRHQLPDDQKSPRHLVAGCVSKVWLVVRHEGGLCHFRCDAESPMVKGLVAFLCDLYSGSPPGEIVNTEPVIWTQCGFDRLLSPTRLNGLKAVRSRIIQLARQAGPTSDCPTT